MEDFLKHPFAQADIDNYISSQAEENIHLDFKRGEALKNEEKAKSEIAKDVSAFANSDGGIIIYGLEEKEHKASNTSFVNGNEITKEWLENVIISRVQRKIDGLQIDVIRYDNKIEQTIYVVKVPRSINAPHISYDKKFHKRNNFSSVPMEEYEVRDLYSRQEKTQLGIIEPKILSASIERYGNDRNTIRDFRIRMLFQIANKGNSIEKLYKVILYVPRGATPSIKQYSTYLQNHFEREELESGYSVFAFPNESPLFQKETTTIAMIGFSFNKNVYQDLLKFPFRISLLYSNGTEEKEFWLTEHLTHEDRKMTIEDWVSY